MAESPTPPPSDTVTLTINGQTVEARKGTLLVEAARQVGIEIPVFCYHPKLKPVGACRMCLVQIEKLPRLQTACTTPVGADMVVHTNTPDVIGAQNGVIELLLANHPLDCPICDKGGECPLQDNTFKYGRGISRFAEAKEHKEKAVPLSDLIVLDRERCIMCYRCTRFHQEIPGDEALAAIERGGRSRIGTMTGESYDSIFSGNTIELCPVGALTSRQYRFKARPWDLVRTPSVCSGCAVGCNLEVHSRVEKVLRLVSHENSQVDGGWLCDRGRFDTVPAAAEVRPTEPLVRDASGRLREATWTEAIQRTASLLGGGTLGAAQRTGILASAALSNEAFWGLERALAASSVEAALWPAAGSAWPVEGAIANLPGCKTVVLAGLDAWHELPVLALWIRKAVANGARLVVIGASNGLFRDTAHWLRTPPGEELATVRLLMMALAGETVTAPEVTRAAGALTGAEGPAAFLVGPSLAAETPLDVLQALATRLGANGGTGLVGAPLLSANGRGAQEVAPTLAKADGRALVSGAASGERTALLLIGDEAWGELDTGAARLVVACSQPVGDDPRVDVVLPLAHPYERQGSITNLEGRVQLQEGGASAPPRARPDWSVVAQIGGALGVQVPTRLTEIRAEILSSRPQWDVLAAATPRLAHA